MYSHIKNVQILISLLKQYGIRHLVISPGTRNTAFAHSVETDSSFCCYSIVDERSAGFFALGLSEALDEPVCVSCTAATATCNYLPAMQEAYERHIQLVALTADQDPYHMFHMEDQCIDQVDMYHGYVKCAVDIPKINNESDYWYSNRRINEALTAVNHHGKGPVQINYHMSYSTQELSTYDVKKLPVTRKIDLYENVIDYQSLAAILRNKNRILVVGGSDYCSDGRLTESINTFFEKYNCAVIADTYANIFSCPCVLNPGPLGDTIREEQVKYLKPDLIISFGNIYYSTVKYFLPSYANVCEHWQISIDGSFNDGYHCLKKVFECRPEEFFEAVNTIGTGINDKVYYDRWKTRLGHLHFQELPFTNLYVTREFCRRLPDKAILHTTVLDSIRMSNYVEMPKTIRCFANIGADGIDGALSTYLGQSDDETDTTFLLIGDLSILYDMNSLLRQLPPNVKILVINNYAGAEFHKNFGIARIPTIDNLVAAGHTVNIKNCCLDAQNVKYISASTTQDLESQLDFFFSYDSGPCLLEVFTEAATDADTLIEYWNINRQEIPEIKASMKSRAKKLARTVLGGDFVEAIKRKP